MTFFHWFRQMITFHTHISKPRLFHAIWCESCHFARNRLPHGWNVHPLPPCIGVRGAGVKCNRQTSAQIHIQIKEEFFWRQKIFSIKILLLTAETRTFCFTAFTCMSSADSNLICTAFAVIIVNAVTCMAVYINLLLRAAHRIPSRISFTLPETGAAGFFCIPGIPAFYHNVSFAAVPVIIVVTIHCRTL